MVTNLKLSVLFGLLLFTQSTAFAQEDNIKKAFDRASNLPFLGQDLNANPSSERRNQLQENQAVLKNLLAQPIDRKDLLDLLRDQNPRMRTLAAEILCYRGDVHSLPHLFNLINDKAPSFPGPQSETQTVGTLVRRMMEGVMRPSGSFTVETGPLSKAGFKEYWEKRKDRDYCAGWFYLMLRGGGFFSRVEATPEKIREVRERIDKIPEPDRTFTLLWVREYPHSDLKSLATDEELIAGLKKVGPENLVQLLQHRIPSTDPDLQSRPQNNHEYMNMVYFVLKNAKSLLRPEDADTLLELGAKHDPQRGYHVPEWYVSALELQPKNRKEILRKVQEKVEKTERWDKSNMTIDLASAVWPRFGDDALDFTVNMVYLQKPIPVPFPDHRRKFFEKITNQQSINRKLVAALASDKRLDQLDWEGLYLLCFAADRMAGQRSFGDNFHVQAQHPLGFDYYFQRESANKNYPKETQELEKTLNGWRQTLRKSLGLLSTENEKNDSK
jgi:hypothetical protein